MRRVSFWVLVVGAGLAMGLVASWGLNQTLRTRMGGPDGAASAVEQRPSAQISDGVERVALAPRAGSVRTGTIVPGEGLMHFGARTEAEVADLLAAADLSLRAYDAVLGVARVGVPEGWSADGELAARLPELAPNYVAQATWSYPSSWGQPWGSAAAEPEPAAPTEVQPIVAGYAGETAVVAILDTGINRVQAFGPNVQVLPGYDFVNEDDDAADDNQHGTHLASIISDVADERARLLPVKVLDASAHGTEFDIARGIRWAVDNGARVINLSLAFPPSYAPSSALLVALEYAFDADVVVVASAGNWGTAQVAYPGAFGRVIGVGAEYAGKRTAYSCYGAALDLLAPGGASDAGAGVLGQTFALNQPAEEGTVALSGTSMAAAHVSGAAAMVLAARPELSAGQVRGLLLATADRSGQFTAKSGAGILDGAAALAGVDDAPDVQEAVVVTQLFQERSGFANGPWCVWTPTWCAMAANTTRVVALVEVLDEGLGPIIGAKVWADVSGSIVDTPSCRTDSHGRCLLQSDYEGDTDSAPAAFALRVGRVVEADGTMRIPMAGFRADEDRAQQVVADLRGAAEGVVVDRVEARSPGAESLLSGRELLAGFTYSPVYNPSTQILMNAAYFAQIDSELVVHLLEDAVRLGSEGEGAPLVWINDLNEALLAEGEGLWGSGMPVVLNLSAWNVKLMYDVQAIGVGAGLWGSGLVANDFALPWLYTAAPKLNASFVLGSGLWGSGMPSFNVYSFSLRAPVLSLDVAAFGLALDGAATAF